MSAYVCFTLGVERYGVPIEHVREVAELGDVVAVPGAGAPIAGIRHLHGDIIPVLRLPGLLGAPGGRARRIVVVRDGDRHAGLAVDATSGVEELPRPEGPGDRLTLGAVLHEDALVGILDVPAVLDAAAGG